MTRNQTFSSSASQYYARVTRKTLLAISLATLSLLVISIPITWFRHNSILLTIHLLFIFSMSLNIFFIKKFGNRVLAVLTIIIPGYIILLYSLYTGTSDTISWFFLFPILSFFLLGKRNALMVNIVYAISFCVVLYIRMSILPEGFLSISVHVLAYCALTSICYFVEENRENIQNRLIKNSMIDFLTGCKNKRCFDDEITRELENARRYNKKFTMLMLDIDFFKEVNDSFGHATGDIVLKEMIQLMEKVLRMGDTIYRFGGDEFLILLPDTEISGGTLFAERMVTIVSKFNFSVVNHITVSIGLTEYRKGISLHELLTAADDALYKAKDEGRNCYRIILKEPVKPA